MSSFEAKAYWESRLRQRYDQRGVGDIGMSRAYNSRLYDVRRTVFGRAVKRIPGDPRTWKVLDVGSGTGFYLDAWARLGVRSITGLDFTDQATIKLRDAFPSVSILKADIGASSPPPQIESGHDVVSAFDVLFHVVDDQQYRQALSNIARSLKPGGWFIWSENLVPREQRLTHYVSRDESMILGAVEEAGFRVTDRIPAFVLMNDPVRSESRLLRKWYSVLHKLVAGEIVGAVAGAALVGVERVATRMVRRAPGTEVLICRRAA